MLKHSPTHPQALLYEGSGADAAGSKLKSELLDEASKSKII